MNHPFFQDNLLAIESDLEELEHESSNDALQRHFHNSKLSDLLDMEQGKHIVLRQVSKEYIFYILL